LSNAFLLVIATHEMMTTLYFYSAGVKRKCYSQIEKEKKKMLALIGRRIGPVSIQFNI
jgi:hypothetical protein